MTSIEIHSFHQKYGTWLWARKSNTQQIVTGFFESSIQNFEDPEDCIERLDVFAVYMDQSENVCRGYPAGTRLDIADHEHHSPLRMSHPYAAWQFIMELRSSGVKQLCIPRPITLINLGK
jgi:hypothetical protein